MERLRGEHLSDIVLFLRIRPSGMTMISMARPAERSAIWSHVDQAPPFEQETRECGTSRRIRHCEPDNYIPTWYEPT